MRLLREAKSGLSIDRRREYYIDAPCVRQLCEWWHLQAGYLHLMLSVTRQVRRSSVLGVLLPSQPVITCGIRTARKERS
jgi:hypothetical protein